MIVAVGTKNKAKVQALKEVLAKYEMFYAAEILLTEVSSDVSDQPKSLTETIQGAKNRAKQAFEKNVGCGYAFGLESGIFKVPHTKSGYMDTTACAIYDGENFHLGLSSCFEYPKELIRLVHEENLDISQAVNKAGFSDNKDIGSAEGMIGILTKGRLNRKEYTEQSIITALVHLENKDIY